MPYWPRREFARRRLDTACTERALCRAAAFRRLAEKNFGGDQYPDQPAQTYDRCRYRVQSGVSGSATAIQLPIDQGRLRFLPGADGIGAVWGGMDALRRTGTVSAAASGLWKIHSARANLLRVRATGYDQECGEGYAFLSSYM